MSFLVKLLCCLILNGVNSKQISESKCDEYASISVNPSSVKPHLMQIVRIYYDTVDSFGPGTLISQDYVLTSAYIIERVQNDSFWFTEFRVRKFKLQDESYSNWQMFNIKRLITHPSYITSSYMYNNIGLIQLSEPISYLSRSRTTIFRPACLWTVDNIPVSFKYSAYEFQDHENRSETLRIKSAALIAMNVCTNGYRYLPNNVTNSHVCCQTDLQFRPIIGTLIDIQVRNQSYLFGLVSDTIDNAPAFVVFAPKVSSFVSWIESIVWPNQTHPECGQRKVIRKPFMPFSEPSRHGEFPWHVAVIRDQAKYICGGTIINSRTVLTAAHCLQVAHGTVFAKQLTVVTGTHTLYEYPIESRNYSVKAVMVHDNFTRAYLENDIAILKLTNSIEFSDFIMPICLSNTWDINNIAMGLVAGWGHTEHNQLSDVLLQAKLPIRNNFECRASNRIFFPIYLNDNNYCAGYANGTNVCSGDSGGAMIFEHGSRWYIRGIVSLGVAIPNSNRCDITQLALFTDAAKFYDWIMELANKN